MGSANSPQNQLQNKNQKSNTLAVAIGIIVLVLIAVYAIQANKKNDSNSANEKTTTQPENAMTGQKLAEDYALLTCTTSTPTSTTTSSSVLTTSGITTVTVTGKNFSYSPNEIKVKKGDTVKVVFQNTGGFHDFVIDEFSLKTATIADGQSETVEFTADKTGTFEFYCSVGTHRQMGMKGNLIVE